MQLAATAGSAGPSATRKRRRRELPAAILRAQRHLDELIHDRLRDLSQRAYRVMRAWLAKVDLQRLHDGQIFDTTSRELERATKYGKRTVSAANSELVAEGLITRPKPDLRGHRTPVWHTFLTPRGVELFFGYHAQKDAPPVDKERKFLGSEDGAAVDNSAPPDAGAPSRAHSSRELSIPADLAPLLQVMPAHQVVTALGAVKEECRSTGRRFRLQDVLRHRLDGVLQAHSPLGLLLHLIWSPEDWTRPAVHRRRRRPDRPAAGASGMVVPNADESRAIDAARLADKAPPRPPGFGLHMRQIIKARVLGC